MVSSTGSCAGGRTLGKIVEHALNRVAEAASRILGGSADIARLKRAKILPVVTVNITPFADLIPAGKQLLCKLTACRTRGIKRLSSSDKEGKTCLNGPGTAPGYR